MKTDKTKQLLAKIAGEYWPAVRGPEGLLVDLRLHKEPEPEYMPEVLLVMGVPVHLVT